MTMDATARTADPTLVASILPPLSALMESASAAVIQLDVEGRVQLWNQAAERLFGWRASEVLGKPPPMIPNELWEDNQSWFLRCLGGQTMSGVQLKRRRKDGSTINLHSWAWAVCRDNFTIQGVMMMFLPVGERTQRPEVPLDRQLKQQTDQAQRFHNTLVALSKTDHPNLDSALQTLTSVASQTLNVERVSIWLFNPERNAIRCECFFQKSLNQYSSGLILTAQDFPNYFKSLEKSRTIAATDAQHDPRTSEYRTSYLEPHGIMSMLDVPIRLHGKEIGIVCHEHTGTERDWTDEEQAFAATIADYVSLAYECQEHASAERALRESQAMLAAVINGSPIGIQVFDSHGVLQRQNSSMEQLAGKLHMNFQVGEYNILDATEAIAPGDVAMAKLALNGQVVDQPQRIIAPRSSGPPLQDEPALVIDTVYYPVKSTNNGIEGLACFHRDVSERKRLEDQLQQTQRLDSLGLLAGTIAHDFNGLLTAIFGFIDLAQNELPTNHVARSYLQSGLQAAVRATELTQQLLSYAGKGKREILPFDLSTIVLEVSELLRGVVTESSELKLDLSSSIPLIEGDKTQIRQVVMNLISNASESHTDHRGMVKVSTSSIALSASDLALCQICAVDVEPGHFVAFKVSDQGQGIAPEVLKRIFDPFFTTKSKGRGLGLAAVVGIIRCHRAALQVESRPGLGTTFTVFLPVISSP